MSAAARLADLKALLRLLERQRRALRTADFAGVPDRTARIEALCARLETADPADSPDSAVLAELRRQAELGLRQVAAALAGLRDAQGLLAAARAPAPDRVYGPDGGCRPLGAATGRLELRR